MGIKSLCGILVALTFMAFASAQVQAAETMRTIFERGKIVIGVKADYKPWGFRDPSGAVIGMEIDMAQDVADKLGVKLEKVVVVGSNRMEFLTQGKIDLIIATMGDNPKRRKVVGMIEPNYYAGGANIISAKSAGFKNWSDIKGKKICGIQGAYYNKRAQQMYAPELMAFKGVTEVTKDLRAGNCQGFIYDSTWIESKLASGEWDGFEMALPTEDFSLWAVGVRLDDLEGAFGRFMSGIVYQWLRSGKLLEIEKKWGVKASDYLVKQQKELNQ